MGRLFVSSEQDGERLDVVLAEQFGSRARAQRAIANGLVRAGGAVATKRHRVRAGEEVDWAAAPEPVAPAEIGEQAKIAIAFEDEHLVVVDKPAGLVVHPAPGHRQGTLVQLLSGTVAGGEDWRAGLVHRLDQDTSGLLVLAKSAAVHAALKEALQARAIERRYTALVEGRPPARTGTIDAPIGRDRRVRTRHSADTDSPREARTHFELVEALPAHTLLEVRLETGRTHQIRVHLEAIGHPVAGDPLYGSGAPAGRSLGLKRQFLHAARLTFDHPAGGEPVDVTSPLPPDLASALESARKL